MLNSYRERETIDVQKCQEDPFKGVENQGVHPRAAINQAFSDEEQIKEKYKK